MQSPASLRCHKSESRDPLPALGSGSRRCGAAPAPSGRGGSAAVSAFGGVAAPQRGFWGVGGPQELPKLRSLLSERFAGARLGREASFGQGTPRPRHGCATIVPGAAGVGGTSRLAVPPILWSLEPSPAPDPGATPSPGLPAPLERGGSRRRTRPKSPAQAMGSPQQLSSVAREEEEGGGGGRGFGEQREHAEVAGAHPPLQGPSGEGSLGRGAATPPGSGESGPGRGWSCSGGLGGLWGAAGSGVAAGHPVFCPGSPS